MKRCVFTILSALSPLLFLAVVGRASGPVDRDGAGAIELAPRLSDEGDLYRVRIDFVHANVPEHQGLVEVQRIAVGGASVPVRAGTLDGVGFGSLQSKAMSTWVLSARFRRRI